ncbi:MAG: VOC family protein [Candidatus Hydrogenedentota bacterium]
MKIKLYGVPVDDQEKALKFYTEILGFVKKQEIPMGPVRYLTVVSPLELDGTELSLEPAGFPAVRTYQKALHDIGVPYTAFEVEDIQKEYERLTGLKVAFKSKPVKMGPVIQAIFDDTCGNLLQIYQV